MTKLVIVESPAKCAKIQGFLGAGWKVIASMGHIRHLKEELDAVGLERDFEPLYEWSKEKAKAIAALKAAAQGVEAVYLAADDDREGEFIAYSVCLLLKLDPATCPRAVFHSITKEEVTKAIQNPRRLDMNRVNAQQARAILDMLIGFTMSPLLWKHVGGQGLSAGRCQTPALRLVVEREDAIAGFQSTTAWHLGAQWASQNGSFASDLVDELEDEESARNFMENHVTETGGTIVGAETKPWTQNCPEPLITSTLQQQASSLLYVNPKRTMQIAQRLYEAGHITYMRTDQATLSPEAEEEAKKQVTETYGPEYVRGSKPTEPGGKKTKAKSKKAEADKTTQDAHEAIRPTHFELAALPDAEDWSAQDRKLYGLIRLRALQSVMAPARGEQRTLTIHSDAGGEDFPWRATFRHTDFLGWRKAALKEDEEEGADAALADWTLALSLKPQTRLTWTSMDAKPHTTNPPQRFNEATLIRELEKRGIGRPSTFASLIGTIQEKSYVQMKSVESRTIQVKHLQMAPAQWPPQETTKDQKVGAEKDRLHPTPLGRTCLGFLLQHFDDLFLYPFTAQMEQQLDSVAKGEHAWKEVVRETWNAYKERYQTLKSAAASPESGVVRSREFGGGLKAVMSRKGPLLLQEDPLGDKDKTVFLGWPLTSWTVETIPEEEARQFAKEQTALKAGIALGEWNGHPLVQKQGPYGTYVEWNGTRVPFAQGETRDTVIKKLEAKTAQNAETRRIGQFEIRKGPYGLYMFKHANTGPKRQFVSVPSALNLETITETELVTVFQNGLSEKARSKGYSQGGSRGGQGGGRGRRGRGRGS